MPACSDDSRSIRGAKILLRLLRAAASVLKNSCGVMLWGSRRYRKLVRGRQRPLVFDLVDIALALPKRKAHVPCENAHRLHIKGLCKESKLLPYHVRFFSTYDEALCLDGRAVCARYAAKNQLGGAKMNLEHPFFKKQRSIKAFKAFRDEFFSVPCPKMILRWRNSMRRLCPARMSYWRASLPSGGKIAQCRSLCVVAQYEAKIVTARCISGADIPATPLFQRKRWLPFVRSRTAA